MSDLSELDLTILDVERSWWKHAGLKEAAIRERTGLTPTRYYQALNRLLDDPAAIAHAPALTERLRRIRARRR